MESKKYVDFDKVITTYKTFGYLNLHNALEAFNEIPAADVRPAVHGKWEKQDANFVWNKVGLYAAAYKCNRCGELNVAETNYCPNCGADMREIINE